MKLLNNLFLALILCVGCNTVKIDRCIPTEYQITKAKETYRNQYPSCELCGLKRNISNGNQNPVHHRIPVHVDPYLAATETNLITLCAVHHFWVGHCGSYYSYNSNLNETIKAIKEAYDKNINKVTGKSRLYED